MNADLKIRFNPWKSVEIEVVFSVPPCLRGQEFLASQREHDRDLCLDFHRFVVEVVRPIAPLLDSIQSRFRK